MSQHIEAIFENGVFRPLQPVELPEHQRVTLQIPTSTEAGDNGESSEEDEELDEEIAYQPLPLRDRKTIRVTIRNIGKIGPLAYDLDDDELETLDELDELE